MVAGVVVLAAGKAAVWLAGGFGARGSSGSGKGAGLHGTTTQTVKREALSAQTTLSATLGYAGSYTVSVPLSGASTRQGKITWLPRAGGVIRQGQVLYRTDSGAAGLSAVREGAGLAGAGGGHARGGCRPAQP